MKCDQSEWTLRFPHVAGQGDGPPEFVPKSLTFIDSKSKFDYCKATFNSDVADNMKKAARMGALRTRQLAELRVGGNTVNYFYFDPNKTEFGTEEAHVTLKDLQESLDQGTVDMQKRQAVLRDLYEEIFEAASNHYIEDIRFTPGPLLFATSYGSDTFLPNLWGTDPEDHERYNGKNVHNYEPVNPVDGKYVVDIQNQSPVEAIWTLNEKYSLSSWVDRDRTLWVGNPEASDVRHIAAPDDSRVWRWTNANVRAPRRPVKRVIVEGAWIDDSRWPDAVEADNILQFFKIDAEDGDRRAVGIAERDDIASGSQIIIEDKSAKADTLPDLAYQHLLNETSKAYSGEVRINPALGAAYTPYWSVSPGDFLHVVPEDEPFDEPYTATTGDIGDDPDHAAEHCGSIADNEIYTISEVQHNVDQSGHWSIQLSIQLYPEEISTLENLGNVSATMEYKKANEMNYDYSGVDDIDTEDL